MPTLCACLVALGFTHDSVQQAISHFETDSNACEKAPYKIESVSQARKIVLAMSRAGERVCWYRLKVKSRYLFWFLVLNDRVWLERRLAPRRRELKIPAVSEDREAILTGSSEHQRRQAYARAYYRDREWMLAAVSGRRSSGQRRQITVARDAALRDSIMKAMAAWFAKPGRPIKFTLERAAASVGVIQSRILNLISRNPQGQGRLYESTTHYRLRVLSWLMREKAQQGVPVTPGQLYKQAGVAPSWTMRHFWAASIVYLFGPPGTGGP
ncbi:hypothetical protein [Variovorax sp. HW608]|uniref:hypothetical protein n=1 Tax=Variovorax sp. HW608 TaxID=1034889 RepID=UPI0012FE57F7|nr:hypothetical protein [Variovorax sp. HW608]